MTVSVRFRLQRITSEFAYVDVKIAPNLLNLDHSLNVDRITELAVKMGRETCIQWYEEERCIQPHPIQKPKE